MKKSLKLLIALLAITTAAPFASAKVPKDKVSLVGFGSYASSSSKAATSYASDPNTFINFDSPPFQARTSFAILLGSAGQSGETADLWSGPNDDGTLDPVRFLSSDGGTILTLTGQIQETDSPLAYTFSWSMISKPTGSSARAGEIFNPVSSSAPLVGEIVPGSIDPNSDLGATVSFTFPEVVFTSSNSNDIFTLGEGFGITAASVPEPASISFIALAALSLRRARRQRPQ